MAINLAISTLLGYDLSKIFHISDLESLLFTWMGAGALGAGRATSLQNAYLAFAVITGLLEIFLLFFSFNQHAFEAEKEGREEQKHYVDVEPV